MNNSTRNRYGLLAVTVSMKAKTLITIIAVCGLAAAAFLAWQVYRTNLAHTTFERYYAFRGCAQLIEKTDSYGRCKLGNGQEIKMVLYKGGWYLDGDLPNGWGFSF